jgi:hypothetical protein
MSRKMSSEADRQWYALEGVACPRVLERRPTPPYKRGPLREPNMLHAHGGYSVKHGEGVALNLIERAPLLLRARRDREARRGGPTEAFFALHHGVV